MEHVPKYPNFLLARPSTDPPKGINKWWEYQTLLEYPLVIYRSELENGPFIDDKDDDLPIRNGDLPIWIMGVRHGKTAMS